MPALVVSESTSMTPFQESTLSPVHTPETLNSNVLKSTRVLNTHDLPYRAHRHVEKWNQYSISGVADNPSGSELHALAFEQVKRDLINPTAYTSQLKPKGLVCHFLMWLSGSDALLPENPDSSTSAVALPPQCYSPTQYQPQQHHAKNDTTTHSRKKRSSSENSALEHRPLNEHVNTIFALDDNTLTTQNLITQTALICLNPAQCQTLAKAIMAWQGLYAGPSDNPLPLIELKVVIRQFLEDNTYPTGFTDYALQRIRGDNSITTVEQLRLALDPDKLASLQQADVGISDFIQQNVVDQKLPILSDLIHSDETASRLQALKLTEVDWVVVNAGLDFYNRLTQHLEEPAPPLTEEEARLLGEALYEQLRAGAAPAELASCFSLASQVRDSVMQHHRLQPEDTKRSDQSAQQSLAAFFSDYESQLLATNPFLNFEHLVNQFKTRPQLAEQVIESECARRDIDVADYLNHPDTTVCPKVGQRYLEQHRPPQLVRLLQTVGLIHREGKILEDINRKFTLQNEKLAEAYGTLDKILVASVFDTLPEAELDFLHHAVVKQMEASFRPRSQAVFMFNNANDIALENYTVRIKNCDFLVAKQGSEERIYVITFDGAAYSMKRIDREREQYIALTPGLIDHFSYSLSISPLGEVIHQPNMPLKTLVGPLVEKHQAHYLRQVHEQGYEPTTTEKTTSFMRSLIPFVACKDAITDGRVDDAMLSCGLDAAIFTGPLAKLGASSARVGQVFTLGVLKSMSNALQASAARQTFRTVLSQAAKDVARDAMHLAFKRVIQPQAPGIATSLLRAVDPGIELGNRLTRGALKSAAQLLVKMKDRFPRLNKLHTRIENALNRLPEAIPLQGESLKGHFSGTRTAVDVIAIGAVQADGSRLCVLSLPNIEITARHQFRLSAQGKLTPVPVNTTLRERLHIILTEGLSGRGTGMRGISPSNKVDAALLQQISSHLGKRPTDSSLDHLAKQFQVKKDKLEIYVREGQLTQAAHDLLDQGPSRIASAVQQPAESSLQHHRPSEKDIQTLRENNAAKKIQSGWRLWQNRIEDNKKNLGLDQTHVQTHNDPKRVNSLTGNAQTSRNLGLVNHTPVDGNGPTLSHYQRPGDAIGHGGNALVRQGPRGFVERVDLNGRLFDIPSIDPSRYSELKSFIRAVDPLGDGERQIMRNAGKDLLKFVYVQHQTLTLQDFQRPLQDLAKLHDKGLYHLDIKMSNMAIRENAVGARTLSFIDCDGITDRLEEPLFMTFRRHVLSPDLDHMIAVTGRADDEHAMALSMMQATDLSFTDTNRDLAVLAADDDLLAPPILRKNLQLFAARFVDKYVLEPYRAEVLRFITLPTEENILKVPFSQTLDFSAPTGIVAAIQSGNAEAITRLGSEALSKAAGSEERIAVLLAQSGQGISGYSQLQLFKGQDAETAWMDLYRTLSADEKVRFSQLHQTLEAQRIRKGDGIQRFDQVNLDSL